MAIYYFDLRDGEAFVVDEEGVELRDGEAALNEAARTLAGFAWDSMRSARGASSSNGDRGARRVWTGDRGQVRIRI